MSPRTVERVDDWETVPFGGGYRGLQDLVSQEFSGVVTAGPARLFMIRGTVVGVLDGDIEDLEGADGTARRAPHHALPLLAVMQEHSEEVRAQYYTEETPIADVNRTLEDGGFTGYVELSENVLSGDYYQVYHQGRSMSVAYVGASERLITDDDAFDQADDEVGIYEVRPVEITPIEVPEPATPADESATEGTDGASTGQATTGSASAEESDDGPSAGDGSDAAESDRPTAGDDGPEPEPAGDETADAGRTAGSEAASPGDAAGTADAGRPADSGTDRHPASPESQEDAVDASRSGSNDGSQTGTRTSAGSGETTGSDPDDARASGGDTGRRETSTTDSAPQTDQREVGPETGSGTPSTPADGQGDQTPGRSPATAGGSEAGASDSSANAGAQPQSAADLETRSIPSLNPSRTLAASKADQRGGDSSSQGRQATGQATTDHPTAAEDRADAGRETRPSSQASAEPDPGQSGRADDDQGGAVHADLREELVEHEEEVADLRADLERVEAERDDLEAAREDLSAERDRLENELSEARDEIARLEERLADFADENAVEAETRLSASQAIDETNLFVRYRSKGDATLESVHAGDASRADVADNLRLEYHTQFDADSAAVGSETFDEFLTNTIQYRFVEWLVESLVYEIRDTGHTEGMADLYNALPKIDRAELNGQVSVAYAENGEEHRSQERFDVVVRDRMGNPLVVANINDSRDPATDSMMTDLVKRAERVGESSDSLAGAVLVTESFFEPEALETADEATSSGLFSRDKRQSFVNLSRKGGFHLCLVEARNQEFHVAVPEL